MLEILTGPDHPTLRAVAEPVTVFDEGLKTLVEEMIETMLQPDPKTDVKGIGIAGNQVGKLKRVMIVTFNVDAKKDHKVVAMINPELVEASKHEVVMEEGCLSLPGVFGNVSRPSKIKVCWQNINGEWSEKKLDGWDARVFQHELDHLNGVLFIDYLKK